MKCLLRSWHAERNTSLVVANAGTDQDDEISGMNFTFLNGMVQSHAGASRTGIAKLFHDRVRPLHRQSQIIHYHLNRRFPHLRENEERNVLKLEAAVLCQFADQLWPALLVDFWRITLKHTNLGSSCEQGFLIGGLNRSSSVNPPTFMIGAICRESGGQKARLGSGLKHRSTRTITVEKEHRVAGIRQLVHQINSDNKNGAEGLIGREQPCRRRQARREGCTSASYVEGTGIFRTQFMLQYNGRGGGDVIRRIRP